MSVYRRARGVLGLCAATLLLLCSGPSGAPAVVHGQGQATRPEVQNATHHDRSPMLSKLPQVPPRAAGAVLWRKMLPYRVGSQGATGDAAVQTDTLPGADVPTGLQNFEGIGNVNGVLPPDTTGDIGPNHYVQMVNLSFAIWDRSGNLLYGPADINTLWQGFGGACEQTNDGDPIVQYDQLADRWLLTQFALPNYPSGPFYQCLAISQTGDPTGAYYRYQFQISDRKLNDYPKFGVWPDGYYMSINQYTCNISFCSWAGAGAVVFERAQMLSGGAARGVYFDLNGVDPNLGGMLPGDLDGTTPPPAGAPNLFCQIDDNAWGYSDDDQLQCWKFQTDWTNPLSSTFTFDAAHSTAPFDSNMCAYARNCIAQPGGTNVDAISDRLMYRLQYRNFGTHETLVTNHTVDASGADQAGVRWYELRNSSGGWSIFQQGTFAPDDHNRWMGSIAMNGIGDIGLGYSISSAAVYPSIAVTGRLDGDVPSLMTQGQLSIIDGTGYQTHASGRWGDYSTMSVDPVDDCTFWYTQEYYAATTEAAGWRTRVGAFKLRECSGTIDTPPTATIDTPASGATVSGTVAVQISAGDALDANGMLTVEWNVDSGAWQPATYNAGLNQYVASWDSTTVGDGNHTINARATDSGGNTASDSKGVTVNNLPPTTMHVADLDGSTSRQKSSWTAAVTITIRDEDQAAVVGATVTGPWTNGATGSSSCTTNGSGQCSVSKADIKNRTGSVAFTVTSVTQASLTYNASDNTDPDGDSNGTTITVVKP